MSRFDFFLPRTLIRTVLASIRFQARLAGKVEERLDKVENAERRERETLWEQRRRVQMKLEHLTTQKAEAFLLFNQGDLTPKAYDATQSHPPPSSLPPEAWQP